MENGELENTLTVLGAALDLRDSEIRGHSRRVCMYALEIAQRLACSEKELKVLPQGALLHDIGKIAIPDAILWKPGPLTDEEWAIMQSHVSMGYELIKDVPRTEVCSRVGAHAPRESRWQRISEGTERSADTHLRPDFCRRGHV